MQLVELQSGLAALQRRHVAVLAASLDPLSLSVPLARRLHLGFPVLQDSGHALGAAFGDYQASGPQEQDGDAVVILDRQGKLIWRHFSAGMPTSTAAILAALPSNAAA
jgi:peroxiredoxin